MTDPATRETRVREWVWHNLNSPTSSGKPAAVPAADECSVVNGIVDNDPVRPEDKDGFYHDILDGLSIFLENSFILDILYAIREYPVLRLGESLNLSQVTCKKWLLDKLIVHCGNQYGTVYVLGGWYGVLGAMFLHDPRFSIDKVISVDIDPHCKPVGEALNRIHAETGRFESVTADVYDLDYPAMLRLADEDGNKPDLLINTSCEHLPDFGRWFQKIPPTTLTVVQSNDYFDCDEHINCVPDLAAFARQAKFSELKYQGELKLKKYTRFMLIGVK